MKKLLKSGLIVAVVALAVGVGSRAFFSDTETSANNTFRTGAIDLKIDNESYYNGAYNATTSWTLKDLDEGDFFFNFGDLKPGDLGEDTISLHVTNNPAYACMDISLTSNVENGVNEPEVSAGDDPNSDDGELAQSLNFVFWTDDGDNVLETEEPVIFEGPAIYALNNQWALADSQKNNVGGVDGDALDGESIYYIAKAWCFGDLILAPVEQDGDGKTGQNGPTSDRGGGVSCNGILVDNLAQTDVVTADVSFYAIQQRNNVEYVCPSCEGGLAYLYETMSSDQGLRKDGSPVLTERSNPDNALGAPDSSFYSLGFGGTATFGFAYPVMNQTGPDVDIRVSEVTNGRTTYPIEKITVEVSQDNSNWTSLGEVTNKTNTTGIAELDFGPVGLSWIKYVRVTDTTDPSIHTDDADGYDLASIEVVQTYTCDGQLPE